MVVSILTWGKEVKAIYWTDLPNMGLERTTRHSFTYIVRNKEKFFLAVIEYGIDWEEA